MKSFKTIISCATALLAATMISCNKENPMQDNGQDNIPASETISVCVDGLLGEYAQENDTKASLSGAIRMKWAAGDKVYAYDASKYLGYLNVTPSNGGMNATVLQEKVRAAEASTEAVSATDQYAKLEAKQEATKRIAAEMQQFAEVSSGKVTLA